MKASLILSSAIQKAVIVAAFLPLAFVIYPQAALAATAAQNPGENALVFDINSKQKNNKEAEAAIARIPQEPNPTLTNPCFPGPVGSCNPDLAPNQSPVVKAQASSIEKANLNQDADNTYSVEEVKQMIVNYSAEYGINPTTPLCIAQHESGFNQFSKNRHSTASGVFQYLTSTWRHTDEGKAGLSIFDADANVKAAVKYMAIHKSTQPWMVRGSCPAVTFAQ